VFVDLDAHSGEPTVKVPTAQLTVFALAAAAAAWLGLRPPPPDECAPASGAVAEEWYGSRELRIPAKQLVAREAADGRWSLVEAAALFRELDRLPPALHNDFLPPGLGGVRTEEERLCRQVIYWVSHRLAPEAPAGAGAVARLDAELSAELQRPEGPRLPDPATVESVEVLLARTRASLTDAQRRAVYGPQGTGRER
jgi:hypothetical protein